MPEWPTGVQTVTVAFGKGITIGGHQTSSSLTIEPIFLGTNSIVWAATGTPLLPFQEDATAAEGSMGSVQIPVVDQAGWVDDGGNAFSMWGYRLTETPRYNGRVGKVRVKNAQFVSGQTTVDFDLIPDGSIGMPVSAPTPAVTSVNGMTGAVTVTGGGDGGGSGAPTGAAGGFLSGTYPNPGVNSTALESAVAASNAISGAKSRANHTGTQTSATISDFTEAVQDAVAAYFVAGTNVTATYDDAAGTLTVTAAGGGGATDPEAVRDAIGAALIGVGLIAVTINDAGDTITVSTTATANSTDAALRDRATHTGTQSADTVTDGTTNKAYTATEKTKLAGVAVAATANSSDASLRDRSTHTGTQAQSTITNLTTDLAGKQPALAAGSASGDVLVWNGTAYAPATPTAATPADIAAEPAITAGTTAQYWRGDKTWQTLPASGGTSKGVFQLFNYGALSVGTGTMRIPVPFSCTILGAVASLGSIASGPVIVDVNRNGTSMFASQDRPTVGTGSLVSPVKALSVAAVAGDYLTIDVDQVGTASTTAPAFVGRVDGGNVYAQAATVSRHAASVVGSIQVAAIWLNTGGTVGDAAPAATTVTVPSGWTRIGTGPTRNVYNAADRHLELHLFWWRDDGTQPTWTFTAGTPVSNSSYTTVSVFTYNGAVTTGDPVNAYATSAVPVSSSTWAAPSVTTTAAVTTLLTMWWTPTPVTSPVYPTGSTERAGTINRMVGSDRVLNSAGATGIQTLTGTTSPTTRMVAATIALTGNATGSPVPGSDLAVTVSYSA